MGTPEKCQGCGREAIKKPVAVCPVCHREVVVKKFGSRTKGNTLELDVAKMLSEWWGEERAFRRTPLSGAWDKRAGGDLVAPEGFPLTVECKNFEAWELQQLLTSDKSLLDKHWAQAVREVQEGKRPLLVFTKNFQPVFYMMTVDDWRGLKGVTDAKKVAVFLSGEEPRVVGLLEDLLAEWEVPR